MGVLAGVVVAAVVDVLILAVVLRLCFLSTKWKEGKDDADTIPAVGGSDDVLHAAEDLISSRPVLASIPGSSNFSDTLRSSFNGALSCFGLCVGRGEAGKAEDQE